MVMEAVKQFKSQESGKPQKETRILQTFRELAREVDTHAENKTNRVAELFEVVWREIDRGKIKRVAEAKELKTQLEKIAIMPVRLSSDEYIDLKEEKKDLLLVLDDLIDTLARGKEKKVLEKHTVQELSSAQTRRLKRSAVQMQDETAEARERVARASGYEKAEELWEERMAKARNEGLGKRVGRTVKKIFEKEIPIMPPVEFEKKEIDKGENQKAQQLIRELKAYKTNVLSKKMISKLEDICIEHLTRRSADDLLEELEQFSVYDQPKELIPRLIYARDQLVRLMNYYMSSGKSL